MRKVVTSISNKTAYSFQKGEQKFAILDKDYLKIPEDGIYICSIVRTIVDKKGNDVHILTEPIEVPDSFVPEVLAMSKATTMGIQILFYRSVLNKDQSELNLKAKLAEADFMFAPDEVWSKEIAYDVMLHNKLKYYSKFFKTLDRPGLDLSIFNVAI